MKSSGFFFWIVLFLYRSNPNLMSYKVNVYCLGNSLLFCSDSVGQAMVNISIEWIFYLYELAEIHGPKAEEKRQKLNSLLPLFVLYSILQQALSECSLLHETIKFRSTTSYGTRYLSFVRGCDITHVYNCTSFRPAR